MLTLFTALLIATTTITLAQGPFTSPGKERGEDIEKDAFGEVLFEKFIDENPTFKDVKANPDNVIDKLGKPNTGKKKK